VRGGRSLGRPAWCSRLTAPRLRGCARGPRDRRSGCAGRAGDSGRATTGRGSWRSVLGCESPWLATKTPSGAPAAHARATSATTRAARRRAMVETRAGRPPRCLGVRPEAAEVGRGAAKIERPEVAAPSAAAGTGAGTSKTLRRPPIALSEVRGIYVREAHTFKTGPPAAGRGGRRVGTAGARSAAESAVSGRPARRRRLASAALGCAARSFGMLEIPAVRRQLAPWGCGRLPSRRVGDLASGRRQAGPVGVPVAGRPAASVPVDCVGGHDRR
jgi:hypothetical protein